MYITKYSWLKKMVEKIRKTENIKNILTIKGCKFIRIKVNSNYTFQGGESQQPLNRKHNIKSL